MKTLRRLAVTLALLGAVLVPCAATAAPSCKAASGPQVTPLVELYTSEGCDSCPPADRWLASRFPAVAAPEAPIALAFHVDYWDRLGWVDRFASPAFTARQYTGVRTRKDAFAYTPQVVLQGRDFAAWRSGEGALTAAARAPARAAVDVAATIEGGRVHASARARIADAALARQSAVVLVYADSGLVSDVKAGENRGVRLVHDHVVRALAQGATGALEASAAFARPAEPGAAATVVAFVQNIVTNDVLQAVALPLADCAP